MHIHLYGTKTLLLCRRVRGSGYGAVQLLPNCRAKGFPQASFGRPPMWLSVLDLPLARFRQAKDPFAPVFPRPDMNPALLAQQGQRARKSRAVHGKSRTQRFLVGFAHDRERGQQTELGDFDSSLAKFLVINPRYDPAQATQVLTRAGQLKKRVGGPFLKSFFLHIICIYIL